MTKQTPAQIRLATYRAKAAKYRANNPTHPETGHYATWRGWRTKQTETRHYGWDGSGGMWLDHHECAPGFRLSYVAHELVRIGHKGWFTDYYENDTVFGVVSVLRLGRNAYVIAGHSHSDWDSDFLDFSTARRIPAREAWDENGHETATLEDETRAMARTADSLAEHFAEKCRADSEKDMAAQRIEQSHEEIAEARETVRELIREIRTAGAMPPTICATIRRRLTDEWAMVQNLRESVRELTAKPYMIHEYR
jgi:hypothetical protein